MSRIRGFDLVTIGVVSLVGIYTGARFFEPIVLGQLEKDGHLRKDVAVPKYDEDGNLVVPQGTFAGATAPANISTATGTTTSTSTPNPGNLGNLGNSGTPGDSTWHVHYKRGHGLQLPPPLYILRTIWWGYIALPVFSLYGFCKWIFTWPQRNWVYITWHWTYNSMPYTHTPTPIHPLLL